MAEQSPMLDAQTLYVDALPLRSLARETISLEAALGRVLASDLVAPMDVPPYPRAIVEGYLVATDETKPAGDASPIGFNITGKVLPGDAVCPKPEPGTGIEVVTGSIVPAGNYSIVRMWEVKIEGARFSITRPFPPGFFIEAQGCDLKKGSVVLAAGHKLTPMDIGNIASLGISQIEVVKQPKITIFASGDEVIPYTDKPKPGCIFDCNSVMLAAAVSEAGGVAVQGGIQGDDFAAFVATVRTALSNSDMVVISGGTAVDGRDFISDLIREVGTLVVDGVKMRSGRPLIMGHAKGKPIVCVAGHPPEALRGFALFGVAAINKISGREVDLPEDPNPPAPMPTR
ncbi:MAG: molybdopterin molybdotransferase MoeA [Gammaproteobacteria bacterium]|nr:molybdopterin molybdotransferase MoeA [Gammaproteobacteria bacterium]